LQQRVMVAFRVYLPHDAFFATCRLVACVA
jgi:hypothetical protein